MPTYEYICQSCDHEFEKFQSMNAAPLKQCPECGGKKLRRLVGRGAGLIFKGTGFYITDYRKKSKGDDAKRADAKAAAESKSGSESKPGPETKSKAESKSASESKAPAASSSPSSASSSTATASKKKSSHE